MVRFVRPSPGVWRGAISTVLPSVQTQLHQHNWSFADGAGMAQGREAECNDPGKGTFWQKKLHLCVGCFASGGYQESHTGEVGVSRRSLILPPRASPRPFSPPFRPIPCWQLVTPSRAPHGRGLVGSIRAERQLQGPLAEGWVQRPVSVQVWEC